MEIDEVEPGRHALNILEGIDALRSILACWISATQNGDVETLLNDLEDTYRHVMQPWKTLTKVLSPLASDDFYRWCPSVFSRDVLHEATQRFFELGTTSRFSVNSAPNLSELERVNPPLQPIELHHIVSLAAMVCISDAVESLNELEDWLDEDTSLFRDGKSFRWLVQHDSEKLKEVLAFAYEKPESRDPFDQKITEARDFGKHADGWASHLDTLSFSEKENDISRRSEKLKKSEMASASAKNPRKQSTKQLTVEVVKEFFDDNKGEKIASLVTELAEKYNVSESTVARRRKQGR